MCVRVCVRVSMYVCMYGCMFVSVYIYIHTSRCIEVSVQKRSRSCDVGQSCFARHLLSEGTSPEGLGATIFIFVQAS